MRYKAARRRALDGVLWWCVYDLENHRWSTDLRHGKYRTKKEAEYAISRTEGRK